MPTPLLVVFVLLCLGGAAWLFTSELRNGPSQDAEPATEAAPEAGDGREQAEGVLSLPRREGATDERRRGDDGRERIDPDGTLRPDGQQPRRAELPRELANLHEREVALLVASGPGAGAADRRVPIGGLQVRCAGAADPARAPDERDLLDRVAGVLERAGARVIRAEQPAACIDARVRRLHAADLALVLRVDPGDARVFTGRPAGGATTTDPRSRALATEIAAALNVASVSGLGRPADRDLVTEAGAIDLPGGAAVALVRVDARGRDTAARDALALELATALGVAASRADVIPRD
jgi:hypothetical protein